MIDCVILAAGRGKRMKSSKPKVLHEVGDKPMIFHTLDTLKSIGAEKIICVYSDKRIKKEIGDKALCVKDFHPSGTASSADVGINHVTSGNVFVLYGDDTFFYDATVYLRLLNRHLSMKAKVSFISLIGEDTAGKGRVLRKKGKIVKIIEERDASEEQKKITEINDGVYIFNTKWFRENIGKITNNNSQKEFYLTDLIAIAAKQNEKVASVPLYGLPKYIGVNTKNDLLVANKLYGNRKTN